MSIRTWGAALFVLGCSSVGLEGAPDGGAGGRTHGGSDADGGTGGMGGEDASYGSTPIATHVPKSELRLVGEDVDLLGLTTDGYAIYAAPANHEYSVPVYAVAIDGGDPIQIADSGTAFVDGRIVFVEGPPFRLLTWTSTAGVHTLPTVNSVESNWVTNTAGTKMVLTMDTGSGLDVIGANVDFTDQKVLSSDESCAAAFMDQRFVTVVYDGAISDFGAKLLAKSWDESFTSSVTLFDVEHDRTNLVMFDPNFGGRVFGIEHPAASAPTELAWYSITDGSRKSIQSGVTSFVVSPDGSLVVMARDPAPNQKSPTTNPSPVNFPVPSASDWFISPDNSHLAYSSSSGLHVVSTVDGTDVAIGTLVDGSVQGAGTVVSPGFTNDSRYVVQWGIDNIYLSSTITHATATVSQYGRDPLKGSPPQPRAVQASSILIVDQATSELVLFDGATSKRTVLGQGVYRTFYTTANDEAVVYAQSDPSLPSAAHGLYAKPLPAE